MREAAAMACAVAGLILAGGEPGASGQRLAGERAEIRRDTFGVPHIVAEDEEAAGFAFGYAMAEDHAAEIGRRYLQARGEAARHFGAGEAAGDFAMQRLDNRGAARRAFADSSRRFRRWLQGFAAGVNAHTQQHPGTVPAWMPVVEPWDPLAYGRMFGVLAALQPPRRLLEKYAAVQEHPAPEPPDDSGSNALALAGRRTASGNPILLGNPHLDWDSLYWEAHVTVPRRLNFYGSTLVGIPVLRAGFNDRIGYVQTNNGPDLQDIYAVPLATGRTDAVLHDRRVRPIERRRVTIDVREGGGAIAVEERTFEHTELGPVIHRTDSHVFVVRSINLEWARQYEGFFELMHADSWDRFRRSLERQLAVSSNFIYADRDGRIAFLWNARLPRRPAADADYSLDVPGDTRRFFWRGVHRLRDLPSLVDPAGGYVQSANNPPWWTSLAEPIDPARYPAYIERGELSLRAQALLEGAAHGPDRFTVDDVRRLKFSSRMRTADRVLPDLLAAASRDGPLPDVVQAGIETLAAWDREARRDSRGAVLFDRFLAAYEAVQPQPFAVPWQSADPLGTPRGLADPAAALDAVGRAVAEVRAAHGTERVAWGDVHRFRIGELDLPADGAPGRHGAVRVLGFEAATDGARIAGRMAVDQPLAGFGDAWVLLVHFTRPVTAWSVLAYGQTTNLASPHSRDQLRLFADHQLRPVWFSEAAIAANLERRYRPAGAGVE